MRRRWGERGNAPVRIVLEWLKRSLRVSISADNASGLLDELKKALSELMLFAELDDSALGIKLLDNQDQFMFVVGFWKISVIPVLRRKLVLRYRSGQYDRGRHA
jgi:hypothetical protein